MSTAMFTVVRAVLLQPLPVREQDRVVVMWGHHAARGFAHMPLGVPQLRRLAEMSRALDGVAGVDYNGAFPWTFREGDQSLRLRGSTVTGNFFQVLGVTPALGRTLLPEDDIVGAARVVVISHVLWQGRFAGDSAIVGRTLWSHERSAPYRIVGVMPPGLEYPRGVEFWSPIIPFTTPTIGDSSRALVDIVGRLRRGISESRARQEVTAVFEQDNSPNAELLRGATGLSQPLERVVVGDVRQALVLLSVAVALVLGIAVGNIANLLLISGLARTRELMVRAALGASVGRLVRQLVAESLVLAVLGGVAGMLVAMGAVESLTAMAPPGIPRLGEVRVDGGVLAFALAVTLLSVVGFGIAPAVGIASRGARATIGSGTRGSVGTRGVQVARRTLVVWQVALTMLVLAGAGLVTRSVIRLMSVDLGIATDRLTIFQLNPAWESFGKDSPLRRWQETLDRIVERVQAVPGVAAATPVTLTPFSGTGGWDGLVTIEGSAEEQARVPWLNMEITSPSFPATMEVPVLRGRFFADTDRDGAPPVVVLSEEAVRRVFPGQNAVGKRVRFGRDTTEPWRTVVGVIANARYRDLLTDRPTIYIPHRQFDAPSTFVAVRAAGDPAAITAPVARAVREAAPGILVEVSGTMRDLMAAPLARPRALAMLLAVFAAVAVTLAAVGIFGVVAASVESRVREIGVRMALGAAPANVLAFEVGRGMRLAVVGVVVGIVLALVGTRVLRSLLYEVTPNDPLTLVSVVCLMLGVALLACVIPARRAARVDPLVAMRAE